MATEITMPQLSDTMDQGTILKWFKKVGDSVTRGDALAEVATDKADLEIESFDEGTLLEIKAEEGQTVKVGSLIAVIGQKGEVSPSSNEVDTNSERTNEKEAIDSSKIEKKTEESNVSQGTVPVVEHLNGSSISVECSSESNDSEERVKISPLAKNIAKSHGIDYSQVSGTGEGGRITRKDVEKVISTPGVSDAAAPASSPSGTSSKQEVSVRSPSDAGSVHKANINVEPLSKMRETIAARMVESVNTAPHFYATSRIEVDALLKTRELLKEKPEYEGITVTHLVIKAVALALKSFPRINAKYDSGNLVVPVSVNIGIITALPDGLLIPVLKKANELPLHEVVQESRAMIQRARAGKPKGDDLQGGTFSISNIGKNEVEHFTAIINPGQGAILAVSSIQDEALVKDGAVVPAKTMRVTLSVDHRIIDGVMAGEFLTYLKKLLEEPVLIFA
jgi:pyruvate dehydrogenase E2 component (dihydrolipoamide acetyltransferase)